MKSRTDRDKNRSGGENSERKRKLPFFFVKVGKDIIKSVVFWCTAVSIVASAFYGAEDAAAFLAGRISQETRPAGTEKKTQTEVRAVQGAEKMLPGTSQAVGAEKVSSGDQGDAAGSSGSGQEDGSADDIRNDSAGGSLREYKTVALTFDDGPHPVYTKRLLDGLLERDVKATFFVIGENIPGNEDLIARMEEEGHLIGNHTYNHVKICDMKKEDACRQVEQTSALVREITGHDTEFVRPPFGAWNKELECSFVMIPVLWDVDPLDWTTSNTQLVVQRVVDEAGDQDIVLLHDVYESSVEAALQIVDILKSEGFEFVTADKLILN